MALLLISALGVKYFRLSPFFGSKQHKHCKYISLYYKKVALKVTERSESTHDRGERIAARG